MKKTTLKLTLFLAFGLVLFSMKAQTLYYEDFRYENEGRGFTVQKVALDGQATGSVGQRVGDIVTNGNSAGAFDPVSRPINRIPNGTTRDQKGIALKNTSEPVPDSGVFINHEIEAWIMMTNQDLSAINSPIVSFWTKQKGVIGGGASLTVWVSTDYTHGTLPSTANWTNETANITGNIATSDVSDDVYVQGQINLSAYANTSVTLAFKDTSNNTAYVGGSNQHGTFLISDVKFNLTPLDVADGAFSALNTSSSGQTNVFNTPTASILNDNFTNNTSAWSDVLTTTGSVPRLFWDGVTLTEMPVDEGYKFEVSGAYNPVLISEVRFKLVNGHSTKGTSGGSPADSTWKVQASNNDSDWDDVSATIVAESSIHGVETAVALTTGGLYRYYRFVLAAPWTATQKFTALQQLDFTVDSSLLSIEDDVLKNAITVYPNPSSKFLNIKMRDQSIQVKKVDLIDLSGKLIYSNNNTNPIDVNDFATGLYVLKIQSQDGGELQKKVVINN